MFKKQIEELKVMVEGLCDEVASYENIVKEKRAQIKDINQALSSLERLQQKQSNETTDISI